MPEPINFQKVAKSDNDQPVECSMALRNDGCFCLIFNRTTREIAFTKLEAIELSKALDLYLGVKR